MRGVHQLTPGRPLVYKTTYGAWASVTWTRDSAGRLIVPQATTNHPSWHTAMERVRRWYEHGKSGIH